jgi:hypothetical protein
MINQPGSEITFPIVGGIFGVGQLATSLKALADSGQIGPWHVGHWIDFRHRAIRIQFGTAADGELARERVQNWHRAHVPAGSGASDAPVGKG